ncbi:MAG: Wzt carbohydrate-binding domain-containing protein, partial [Cyanobacteriota bacterium]|nr:Wzt carbohydrate-binding domain-containing protein [Cyanobacteriota bacterium]
GDASFQKKCLGKMEDVADREGRTVLFVSHQMAAISRLCEKSLLFKTGLLELSGSTQSVINKYSLMDDEAKQFPCNLKALKRKEGTGQICFETIRILNDGNETNGIVRTGSQVSIQLVLCYKNGQPINTDSSRIAVRISSDIGASIILSSDMLDSASSSHFGNPQLVCFTLPKNPLTPGKYRMTLFLECSGVIHDWINDGIPVLVEPGDFYGSGKICPSGYEGKAVLVDYSVSLS